MNKTLIALLTAASVFTFSTAMAADAAAPAGDKPAAEVKAPAKHKVSKKAHHKTKAKTKAKAKKAVKTEEKKDAAPAK